MKSICYIVPYFGKLPRKSFSLWLMSCKYNPTINWIIFTDDKSHYDYPDNVKVKYYTYKHFLDRLQSVFDEPICVKSPWYISFFKPVYGEVFADDLAGYDFWGHCDIDLIWGDIRSFITDDILNTYEKIGFQGYSTIYKNTPEVNSRYKFEVPEKLNYKDVFFKGIRYSFDEDSMEDIYNYLGIPYYKKTNFANLAKYDTHFKLLWLPANSDYKNKCQVFTWENGHIKRYYLYNDTIYNEEFLCIHFWCRPMSYFVNDFTKDKYLIYSDVVSQKKFTINKKLLRKKGKGNPFQFYIKSIWKNRKKLTMKKIIMNIKESVEYRKNSK